MERHPEIFCLEYELGEPSVEGSLSFLTFRRDVVMATYAELKAQAEALLAQAEQLRKQERAAVIAEIRARMAEYGITAQDLVSGSARKGRGARAKGEIKYRGPNGETWSGGPGRKPAWVREILAAGGNIENYRVA
jgi:DNA-binding protein H-NS